MQTVSHVTVINALILLYNNDVNSEVVSTAQLMAIYTVKRIMCLMLIIRHALANFNCLTIYKYKIYFIAQAYSYACVLNNYSCTCSASRSTDRLEPIL